MGIFALKSIFVGDLFAGAIIPGLCLVGLYLLYLGACHHRSTVHATCRAYRRRGLGAGFGALAPPLLLIVAVLGWICGYATPTEAAGVGVSGRCCWVSPTDASTNRYYPK